MILASFVSTLIIVCFCYPYKKFKKEKDLNFYKAGPLFMTMSGASKLSVGIVSSVGAGVVGAIGLDQYCKRQDSVAGELIRDAIKKGMDNTTDKGYPEG